ncbi:MAG: hypothetical protein WBV23_12780 [Desulfobaccales bacterium]
MDIPSPGMIGNHGAHLDQALNQPIHGSFNYFAPDIELPDHVEEVVSQKPHLQPGLVGLEALATGLIVMLISGNSCGIIKDMNTLLTYLPTIKNNQGLGLTLGTKTLNVARVLDNAMISMSTWIMQQKLRENSIIY